MDIEKIRQTGKPILIAGPCAAESQLQIRTIADHVRRIMGEYDGVEIALRASCWKPRTKPGFDGTGEKGLHWLAEQTKSGLTVATEVLLPNHVCQVMTVIGGKGDLRNVVLWLGSRNQNHMIQTEIARMMLDMPSESLLMIKNQPWWNEKHWLGILDHVLSTGFPLNRIMMCHRGFTPDRNEPNPKNLRNSPDWKMAKRVQEQTGVPMIIDPSHMGGTVPKVIIMIEEGMQYDFNGWIIETHPNPIEAQTDTGQQLSPNQLQYVLEKMILSPKLQVKGY